MPLWYGASVLHAVFPLPMPSVPPTVPAATDLNADDNPTVAHAVRSATTSGLPVLEARLLLMSVTGLTRTQLITRDSESLTPELLERFHSLVARRLAGEPVAYLLGEREFFGRPFAVTPAVLIPRPDTETLVEWSLDALAPIAAPRILELGTGSGIIAVTLALERPDAQVLATDISTDALLVATGNATTLSARNAAFSQSDWYDTIEAQAQYHLIVSNPPYIAADDPHLQQGDLRFEPRGALTDHGAGLADIEQIVTGALARLVPGGWLLLEHGYDQSERVRERLASAGFAAVASRRDLAGHERCSGGRKPVAPTTAAQAGI